MFSLKFCSSVWKTSAIIIQGFHGDWKNLEDENGRGKVMEHEKSWNFVISHGILPVLPLNYKKKQKFSIDVERLHFP